MFSAWEVKQYEHVEIAYVRLGKGKIMNQEQVTADNTEEKAAEVTASSEMAGQPEEAVRPKGKWFGRGIYGSKDVPIRILDGLIGVLIVVIVGMIIFFAVRGGFNIMYDTDGGSEVPAQKIRYGEFITEPETPYKPGYTFDGWYTEKEGETVLWYFQSEKVTGDMTLTAHWIPAQFTVKFDYDGGTDADGAVTESKQVTFGGTYGTLPEPVKEGKTFAGWEYSGQMITADTVVQMTGEHVLTAIWK